MNIYQKIGGIVTIALLSALTLSGQMPEKIAERKVTLSKEMKQVVGSYQRETLDNRIARSKASATESGLKADFSVQSQESANIVWSENFDTSTTGWAFTSSNPTNLNWKRKTDLNDTKKFNIIQANNVASLYIEGYYRLPNETASATSPSFIVPDNGQLLFYLGHSLNWKTYCSMSLNISVEGGAFAEIWNTTKGSQTPPNWVWRAEKVNLESYTGKNIQMQWLFKGYMGDFALDSITVSGVKPIESIAVKTGDKVRFKNLSTGNITSYQWSFPGGTPSSSTDAAPEVFYKQDGVYDVTLTVSDATSSDYKTRTAFVSVSGTKPKADILPPATFRSFSTRYPFIAPLSPVQYKDNSSGFPTQWTWAFSGISPTSGSVVSIEDENPQVGYSFRNNQNVGLFVSNQHGMSDTSITVTVDYSALISNFRPKDTPFTFDYGDGFGSFPGSNKLKITDYAEKFSKPSKPILVYGVNAYFTKAMATELYEQIQSVSIRLCRSENGLPGEALASESWAVFELDQPAGSTLVPTTYEFSTPVAIDEEFFIVVSGIPALSDVVDVQMATAKFRASGNTAYLHTRDGWKAASDYFPAGSNHTSLLVTPLIAHSVMQPFIGSDTLRVGKNAGNISFPLFSYFGYKTPVDIEGGNWCRITTPANGLTLDTIKIGYDRLPDNLNHRTAVFTFTDGLQSVRVALWQDTESSLENISTAKPECFPVPFNDFCIVRCAEKMSSVSVFDLSGRLKESIQAGGSEEIRLLTDTWASGIYVIKIVSASGISVQKIIKE